MGTRLPEARLVLTEIDPSTVRFLDVRLENVLVTNYTSSGRSSDGHIPTESLSLNFDKVTWTYTSRHPTSRLPLELLSASADLTNGIATGATNPASFTMTGIRKAGGDVELRWQGKAGQTYDVYAVTSLTGAFSLRGQTIATADGPMQHTEPTSPGAMCFVVEERP